MQKIQDLFDPSKQLNRKIESVVTFAAHSPETLKEEIKEYVVTQKLHDSYENVITRIQDAFADSANEVGIWVSGFYGSGKSSFAKYLGYSFDNSLIVDGVRFGERLMSRIQDASLKAMHNTLIKTYNPLVILIDMSTQATAGKNSTVSDIVYYETMKALGVTSCNDPKVLEFLLLVHEQDKYEEFCEKVKEIQSKEWKDIQNNALIANMIISRIAPRIFPDLFPNESAYLNLKIESMENEEERFDRIYKMVKKFKGKDRIIFVLDEVGQFIAPDEKLILNMQGVMQILKDKFKGKVWLIATAQQTLTEDNPNAQVNSSQLYKLNDRFPIKVDIEADDIKEVITKRLLGKSPQGKDYLKSQFNAKEGEIKFATRLTGMERSNYIRPLDDEKYANLYPFLPVHIDILMALLQKLASRTGGVGLRSVIRLIRDILVDNKLADANIGILAGPEHFYDVLRTDMEKNADFKEIVISAQKAIGLFSGDELSVRICKTIAIMQILDDFSLTFDNLCALLYNKVGKDVDKTLVRSKIEDIRNTEGITLQEIEGKYRFMTNVILSIQEERNRIQVTEQDKVDILKVLVSDILQPVPSVSICGTKTINAGVELAEARHLYSILQGDSIKINSRYVTAADYQTVHNNILTESTRPENNLTIYWICTLPGDNKDLLLQDIVRGQTINNRHRGETNKEVTDYLKAQKENSENKKRELRKVLVAAQDNSEMIFRGSPKAVKSDNYKTEVLKPVAEQVYNKYSLASTSMKGSAVESLAQYEEFTTVPQSLNPLGIIKTDGSIDITNQALVEVKDYVSSKTDLQGNTLLNHFEEHPYGWSKDTTRYLVALLLKASVLTLKSGAKVFKVFNKNAAAEMKSNILFGHLGIALNTDEEISPKELLNAIKVLKELFNPAEQITPQKDSIAKVALKQMNGQTPAYNIQIETLRKDFESLHLSGIDKVERAQSYCKQIIDSDGAEAARLLSKDPETANAFKFVNDVLKCEKTGKLISHIKEIHRLLDDIETLSFPSNDFKTAVTDIEEAFNSLRENPDTHACASDYDDLLSKLKAEIEKACTDFVTTKNEEIQKEVLELKQQSDYDSLTDEQKSVIDAELDCNALSFNEPTIAQLRDMMKSFVNFQLLGKKSVLQRINKFVLQNQEAAAKEHQEEQVPNTPKDDNEENKHTSPKAFHKEIKRKIQTRAEAEDVIGFLQEHMADIDSGASIELSLSE